MNILLLIGTIMTALAAALLLVGYVKILMDANWDAFNTSALLILLVTFAQVAVFVIAAIVGFKFIKEKTKNPILIILGVLLVGISLYSLIADINHGSTLIIINGALVVGSVIYLIGAIQARR